MTQQQRKEMYSFFEQMDKKIEAKKVKQRKLSEEYGRNYFSRPQQAEKPLLRPVLSDN